MVDIKQNDVYFMIIKLNTALEFMDEYKYQVTKNKKDKSLYESVIVESLFGDAYLKIIDVKNVLLQYTDFMNRKSGGLDGF